MIAAETRRASVRAIVDQILNGRDWSAASRYFSEDVVVHHPTQPEGITGVGAFAELVRTAYTGFPDWKFDLRDLVVEGDLAAGRARSSGTHTGDFVGFPPTGERFEVDEIVFFRFAGDRVEEAWIVPDLTGQMQQLGLIPEGPPPKPLLLLMRLANRKRKSSRRPA